MIPKKQRVRIFWPLPQTLQLFVPKTIPEGPWAYTENFVTIVKPVCEL